MRRYSVILISLVVGLFLVSPVYAQDGFAGSNDSNYYCPAKDGYSTPGPVRINDDLICTYIFQVGPDENADGEPDLILLPADEWVRIKAIPNPPTLRQLEFWFVRLLYAAWALAGIFFTLVLMWIGFMYLTSFGNEVALAEVIKRFRNWLIGLALVFLSYPVLRTFFNVLGVDQTSRCYQDLSLPGFQFFFPDACVATNAELEGGAVNAGDEVLQ